MHAEIKSRLNFGNLVQNLLSSSFLSQNIKVKTYRTLTFMGVKPYLLLQGKQMLRVFENRLRGGRSRTLEIIA
jgi:hypothetical protein